MNSSWSVPIALKAISELSPSRAQYIADWLFFTIASLLPLILALLSLLVGAPVIYEYARTGLVPRLPTALLSTALMLLACLSLVCGLILDTVTRGRWEAKRMAYLAIPGPHGLMLP